ncbi:hypothetical protein QE152_g4778 [Popillia japonica]|uniref:Uncharacterized protein n=1 Tax=Popillia japonica TaxID=7064 RepID=A0AAW1MS58_POPJA
MVLMGVGGIVAVIFLNIFSIARCFQYDCTRTEYNKCVRIADPLVRDMHLVFPDNLDDIDTVCRTWNRFIDCLQTYTDRCFTADQRKQFNNAVKNPIDSVHQMCVRSDYQREYLIYAPCIKSTITDSKYCSQQYNLLVQQVSQGDDISRATLCCSHDRFKKCIESETRNLCDNGRVGGPASRFSTQIVGKALSFLQDECVNYIPNSDSGDCTISLPKKDGPVIESIIPAAPSEIYPWSTIHDISSREPSTKLQPSRTTTAWLPNSDSSVPDMLGGRTRPSSYGRSSGWSDYSTQNTQPSFSTKFSETVTSPKPELGTISTWSVLNQQPSSLGTSTINDDDPNKSFTFGQNPVTDSSIKKWYPAAGSQVENEVDEPNQQGLIKPKNNAGRAVTCTVLISLALLQRIIKLGVQLLARF